MRWWSRCAWFDEGQDNHVFHITRLVSVSIRGTGSTRSGVFLELGHHKRKSMVERDKKLTNHANLSIPRGAVILVESHQPPQLICDV